jgi:hypothetical protein
MKPLAGLDLSGAGDPLTPRASGQLTVADTFSGAGLFGFGFYAEGYEITSSCRDRLGHAHAVWPYRPGDLRPRRSHPNSDRPGAPFPHDQAVRVRVGGEQHPWPTDQSSSRWLAKGDP